MKGLKALSFLLMALGAVAGIAGGVVDGKKQELFIQDEVKKEVARQRENEHPEE